MALITSEANKSNRRNSSTSKMTIRKLVVVALIFAVSIIFYSRMKTGEIKTQDTLPLQTSNHTKIARSLYLYLCENQAEADGYLKSFPSISADVIILCWKENCSSTKALPSVDVYVSEWSSTTNRDETLIYLKNEHIPLEKQPLYHKITSRAFIINEQELGLKTRLTWTTSRNKLYDVALEEEKKQGWRWAYFNFGDGDVHTICPLAERLLSSNPTLNDEEEIFAYRFRSFAALKSAQDETKCYLLFDAFLLTVSPAISIFSGLFGPMTVPGSLTEVAYHVDAMFNAIHRDALQFLLPYCPRYDTTNWWTSQAIFVYRSLCVYGHILRFDGVQVVTQTHRSYPRTGSAWQIHNDMNLVPASFVPLQSYMKTNRVVSPMHLTHYGGWRLDLVTKVCRKHHTAMRMDTCLVHGN